MFNRYVKLAHDQLRDVAQAILETDNTRDSPGYTWQLFQELIDLMAELRLQLIPPDDKKEYHQISFSSELQDV